MSSQGGAICYGAIGQIFSRVVTSRLGFRITLHDARDAAATTWAIFAPDQIGVSRDLLAHADLRTTTKYYNRARGIEASRAYRQVIAGNAQKTKSAAQQLTTNLRARRSNLFARSGVAADQ